MVKAQKQIKADGSTIITNRDLFTGLLEIDHIKDLINIHIRMEDCYLEKTKYKNTYLLTGPQIEEEIYVIIAKMNGGGAKEHKKFVIPYGSKKFRELLSNHRVEIFGVFPTIPSNNDIKFALCRVSDAEIRRSSIYQEILEGKTDFNSSSKWFKFNDLYNALINNTTIKIDGEKKIIPFSLLDDFITEEYCTNEIVNTDEDGLTTEEAKNRLIPLCGIPFQELFKYELDESAIKNNKGLIGQMLEKTIGKPINNKTLDFKDGELKSFKCDKKGKPKETISLSQINNKILDDLLEKKPFHEMKVYTKIINVLYVPIVEVGLCKHWYCKDVIHINLRDEKHKNVLAILKEDYEHICDKANEFISNGDNIHSIKGKYLEIRPKDAQPYKPLFSKKYNRYVSNKRYGFMLRKDFIKEIVMKECA